jgi:hypothetical protein
MRTGMDVSLSRLSSRVLLVAAALGCAGALSLVAGRRWLAAHWAGTRNPADWQRAIRLEPNNPGYWRQLGLYEQWDFEHGNIQRAIQDFQRTTEIDPRNDLYWMDLASAYETNGENEPARQAYQKALAAHPASAAVAWRYGSFLLRRGEEAEAARQIRRALTDEPKLAASAVSQFWRAGVGVKRILAEVLPASVGDYLAAIDYFVSLQEEDAALASWEKLAGLGRPFPLEKSFALIDSLNAHNRIGDAERVWRQALVAAGRGGEAGSGGSLVFNGGFEQEPVDGGFGWRRRLAPGSGLYLVTDVVHSGSRSARVTFDGSVNVDFSHLQENVAVTPGRTYRFSAYMRTDNISTDSGPQFQITDMTPPFAILAETPAMTGTHPWTEVNVTFTAGPQTHGVTLTLRRVASRMFDNKIRGTVWVDDVRLSEVAGNGVGGR